MKPSENIMKSIYNAQQDRAVKTGDDGLLNARKPVLSNHPEEIHEWFQAVFDYLDEENPNEQ